MIQILIVSCVLFCGLVLVLIDEIKYRMNLDPILRDMIKESK